jgi:hypothetical protein
MEGVNKLTSNIASYFTQDTIGNSMTVFILLLSVIGIILFIIGYRALKNKLFVQCDKINNVPPKNLLPITDSDMYNYPVNFYYIKTSYNSCSVGSYVADYVSLCILEKIISQGVRCFDFEIFNIDDVAVISTSLVSDTRIKETLNYVLFSDAMMTITNQAFSSLHCSNYTDPVFISLRMKTNSEFVYNNIATILAEYQNKYLLDPDQGYTQNNNTFCSKTILKTLMNKIVIMVSSPATILESSNLKQYVNVLTGPSTVSFKYETFLSVNTDSKTDTITYAKEKTIFVTPNIENGDPENPDPIVCLGLGIQFIGMSYQKIGDSNLDAYQGFFDKYKNAFIMKNSDLLPHKTIVSVTVPDESADPHQCNKIMMGDKVVGEFGSGCAE